MIGVVNSFNLEQSYGGLNVWKFQMRMALSLRCDTHRPMAAGRHDQIKKVVCFYHV